MPEGSPSVLIIRLDGIGDALALTPALAALHQSNIPVDVVLGPANRGVFAPSAARDAIVADFEQRSSAASNLAAIERLGGALHSRSYSHVVVATEDPGGYRLAAAIGAPARIGFTDPWSKLFKALWTNRLLTQRVYRSARLRRGEHECATLFRLVAPLTSEAQPTRDLARLRPLVLDVEPEPDERIAVQISDKWERLGIAFGDVVELVRRIRDVGEVRLFSSAREAAYAHRIEHATGIGVETFDDIRAWKSAIGAAAALIAPDSGALHVAGMVGTPIVALFADERNYDAQVSRWAPWAAPQRVVRASAGWPRRAAEALVQLRSV